MNKIVSDSSDDEIEYLAPGQRRPQNARRPRPTKSNKIQARLSVEERAPEQAAGGLLLSPGLDVTEEERAYLLEQLTPAHQAHLIRSVLRRVKGGKEANVYCCAAHPATGLELVAAKLYRPRQFRNLKNDARYRQGRAILHVDGSPVDQRDWRAHKAVAHKSRFGLRLQQTSWTAYEFFTLQRLHAAGADVPKPLHNSEHVLLMEYIGEVSAAAPTLHLMALEPDEAPALFAQMLRNIEILLQQGCVHGDLSAYNVLYWEGQLKLIDFPQVVDARGNPEARAIFERDLTRICQYFARYGVASEPLKLARALWDRTAAAREAAG